MSAGSTVYRIFLVALRKILPGVLLVFLVSLDMLSNSLANATAVGLTLSIGSRHM